MFICSNYFVNFILIFFWICHKFFCAQWTVPGMYLYQLFCAYIWKNNLLFAINNLQLFLCTIIVIKVVQLLIYIQLFWSFYLNFFIYLFFSKEAICTIAQTIYFLYTIVIKLKKYLNFSKFIFKKYHFYYHKKISMFSEHWIIIKKCYKEQKQSLKNWHLKTNHSRLRICNYKEVTV